MEADQLVEILNLVSFELTEAQLAEIALLIEAGEPVDLGSGDQSLQAVVQLIDPDDSGPPLVILGGSGNDLINGIFIGEGTVELSGDQGNDLLWGIAAEVLLDGGSGDDTLYAQGQTVLIEGGSGDDFIEVLADSDFAGPISTLYGGSGHDTLFVDTGEGIMFGGSGRDLLSGLEGDDVMTGGSGRDGFLADYGYAAELGLFTLGDDLVTDFRPGRETVTFRTLTEDQIAYFMAEVSIAQDGDDTLIDWGEDPEGNEVGTMRLLGVEAADFDVEDIEFTAIFES